MQFVSGASFPGMTNRQYDFGSQTAEDRYGVPENFLEIEVINPKLQGDQNKYVDYEIVCRVFGFN